MPKVLRLLLRYGEEKYPEALPQLNQLYCTQLPGIEFETVIIDNALEAGFVQRLDAGTLLIGGDNSSWEFSGWDQGLKQLGLRIWEFDYINVVTSAFHELYNDYLKRFTPALLKKLCGQPLALGHIDCFNATVRYNSFAFRHWMRSSFFFLPPAELRALQSLVSIRSKDGIFSGNPEKPFAPGAPLSQNYQEYIYNWLTGAGTGQGVEWHSKFGLSRETLPYFEQKTLAILNEQLLSCRLRAAGCRLIDVTWLTTALTTKQVHAGALSTPWEVQLSQRKFH